MKRLSENTSANNSPLKMSPNVLIVSDNKRDSKGIRNLFSESNYSLITASSEEEAQDLLKGLHIDLVIVDVNTPSTSGDSLIEQLRDSTNYTSLPLFSFSGRTLKVSTSTSTSNSKAKGTDMHFSKDNIEGLINAVSQILTVHSKTGSLLEQIRSSYVEEKKTLRGKKLSDDAFGDISSYKLEILKIK